MTHPSKGIDVGEQAKALREQFKTEGIPDLRRVTVVIDSLIEATEPGYLKNGDLRERDVYARLREAYTQIEQLRLQVEQWKAVARYSQKLASAIQSRMTPAQINLMLGEHIKESIANFKAQDTSSLDPDLVAWAESVFKDMPRSET